jgi:monothiol glutaredoxin
MNTLEQLQQQINDNKIILYMKGTKDKPQCGFSAHSVKALNACGANFVTVDVLADPEIRATLPQIANWPTFPQLYVNGELIGGCDIILEMYESGELQQLINEVQK